MNKLTGWQAVAREIGDYTITDDMADSRGRVTPSEWCPNSQHDPLGDWLPAEAAAKEIMRLRERNAKLERVREAAIKLGPGPGDSCYCCEAQAWVEFDAALDAAKPTENGEGGA